MSVKLFRSIVASDHSWHIGFYSLDFGVSFA